MNRNSCKKMLSLILCMVLIAAMALFASGCSDQPDPTDPGETTEAPQPTGDVVVKGEGKTAFRFLVVKPDGTESQYEIHTDEETVGAALMALELLQGEQGPYGLYVKTVDGVTLDYEKDGMYWSGYVGGEYAMTGVDSIAVEEGMTFAFKAESAS